MATLASPNRFMEKVSEEVILEGTGERREGRKYVKGLEPQLGGESSDTCVLRDLRGKAGNYQKRDQKETRELLCGVSANESERWAFNWRDRGSHWRF